MALLSLGHTKPLRGLAKAVVATLAALALLCAPVHSASAQRGASLDEVKAAFVFQFANYITWPEDGSQDKSAAFVIGIVGNDDMAKLLRESTGDKSIGGRPVIVHEIESAEAASKCQILFLDRGDDKRVNNYLEAVAKKPVLTVSDDNNFTDEGGIIKLYEEQNKIRIEINVDASERSKLVISSKLLSLAKVVHDRG